MLRGLTTTFLLALNLALWGTLVLLGGVLKLFTRGEARRRVILALSWMAERWVSGNNDILNVLTPTVWDVRGLEGNDREVPLRCVLKTPALSGDIETLR